MSSDGSNGPTKISNNAYLYSPSNAYEMVMGSGTCTLGITHVASGKVVTPVLSSGGTNCYFTIQTDGNLCMYLVSNNAFQACTMHWVGAQSAIPVVGPFQLLLSDDGNLEEYDSKNAIVWTTDRKSRTQATTVSKGSKLVSNVDGQNNLQMNEYLSNGGYTFVMQSDCNLVLYNPANAAVWSTKTNGKSTNCYLTLQQTDGNLCIYNTQDTGNWGAVWCTMALSPSHLPVTLSLSASGAVTVTNSVGSVVWKKK